MTIERYKFWRKDCSIYWLHFKLVNIRGRFRRSQHDDVIISSPIVTPKGKRKTEKIRNRKRKKKVANEGNTLYEKTGIGIVHNICRPTQPWVSLIIKSKLLSCYCLQLRPLLYMLPVSSKTCSLKKIGKIC